MVSQTASAGLHFPMSGLITANTWERAVRYPPRGVPMANDRVCATSRRSFLNVTAAASAAIALRIVTEPMLARAREHHPPTGAVMIDANENPLGPCVSAREAVMNIV